MQQPKFILAALLTALLGACATQPAAAPESVAQTIAHQPQLSTLNGLVVQAGLTEMLATGGPMTVFAPTNDAFKAVPAKTMDELAHNPAQLKALLSYHVLPARVASMDVKNGSAKTANGAEVALSRAGQFVTVEDAVVQTADIAATNGVVHTVDRVLMPPRR